MSKSTLELLQECAKSPLETATSLPFASYRSEAVYQAEKQAIFHKDWVFVCLENELREAGDYLALTIADEPVMVVRGKDQQLRALSNVCRHRGTLLNPLGKGNAKRMVCPYHAWTYSDQGKLLGVPFVNDNTVDKAAHCLPEFALTIWHGLVFISLSLDVPSLHERYSGIDKYLEKFDIKRFNKSYRSSTEAWTANWKLAMENAMESYHLFKVHKNTLEQVTPTKDAFYLEGSAEWSVTAGKTKDTANKLLDWMMGNDSKFYEHYVLISLPPSFVGILTYESFDWVSVLPNGPTDCIVNSGGMSTIVPSPDSPEQQFTEAFFSEDKAICERVQQGMSAVHTKGGKLVEIERVVVDFHHYLANRLFNEPLPEAFQASEAESFLD